METSVDLDSSLEGSQASQRHSKSGAHMSEEPASPARVPGRNINVIVRVRPLSKQEEAQGDLAVPIATPAYLPVLSVTRFF